MVTVAYRWAPGGTIVVGHAARLIVHFLGRHGDRLAAALA